MIALEFTDAERTLLLSLLTQYEELMQGDDPTDAALGRLFPVAYRDDPDAAAEFARYTRSGLVDHKTANSGAFAATLAGEGIIRLDVASAERWLPVLTDLRLILAERIGIVTDDDDVPDDDLGQVYHWLGALQSYLVEALDALGPAADGGGAAGDLA